MREATAVLGTVVAIIVAFTILSGGNLLLGTSPQGPYFNFGYKGPKG